MGLLRLLLSLGVLSIHYSHITNDHPRIAEMLAAPMGIRIHCFFIISGYYTAMLLATKFAQTDWRMPLRFYFYRAVRLLPDYYLALAIAIALGWYWQVHLPNPVLLRFFKLPNGLFDLHFWSANLLLIIPPLYDLTADMRLGHEPFHYLAIGPCYTLACEFTFILVAPFITKAWRLWPLTLVFLGFSVYFYWHNDIVGVYFFSSFVYFLLGMVMYRLYLPMSERLRVFPFSRGIAYFMVAMVMVGIYNLHEVQNDADAIYSYMSVMLMITLVVPFIALATNGPACDRVMGMISYPIYLIHIPLIEVLFYHKVAHGYVFVLFFACLFAGICYFLIDEPLRNWRHSLLKTQKN